MARDPERIISILSKVHEVWNRWPDMRFGQLLIALDVAHEGTDIFYIEDDVMEEKIDKAITMLDARTVS